MPPSSLNRVNSNSLFFYFHLTADDDEVTFDPGDVIVRIEKVDDGWWAGEVNGKRGLFPANYVEIRE